MTTQDPLGLGLIGCGAFGLFCIDAYRDIDDLKPVAVCDVRQDVAQDFARDLGVDAHGDPAELIARDDVDIVHIATPPSTHHELVLQAVRAGKHVLCEKPLAMTTAQAEEMLAAAAEKDVIAPVNFVLRYNAVSDAVKAVLDSGVLGQMLRGQLTNCAADSNLHPEHWFWNKALSGGIFIEHGVHFFDLYRYWLGEGRLLSSHVETRDGTSQEDRVMCTLQYPNGAIANHYHGFDQVGPMDRTNHRLVCELGDIWIDGWIPLSMVVDVATDEAGIETLKTLLPDADINTIETFQPERQQIEGRGKSYPLTRRVRVHFCPQPDKSTVYSNSVRDLMKDQIAFIRDPGHSRVVAEANGRHAVALAEAAATMANA